MAQNTLLRATMMSGLASLLLVSGCDRQAATDQNAAAPTAQAARSTPAGNSRNEQLLAAAEPYEALTEQAFTAPVPDLRKLLGDARAKAMGVASTLDPEAGGRLRQLSGELDLALRDQDRTALAIAAVESYKVLVSAQDAAVAKVPVEVSLLDYAGFKYDAILKSKPARWDEMAKDVDYARATWSKISGRVTSPGLKGAFDQSLGGMAAAVKAKNAGQAGQAAAGELALVDLLEEHFAAK